eukprot:TRINITY_DN409_c8_g1_i1.p1 TRINITY_DN409_c8_g1~~TRINITY_DN409_c8_g1_i1.p1  ORF type:complete len:184 (+),score=14.79 TRINITY_DN409_c8_g1_i1:41-553(+)
MDYQRFTGSKSAFGWPKKPSNLTSGSGIYPNVHTCNWISQPQCSPPGEFVPRPAILNAFKNKNTCFEYYRRLYALGWTTAPLGDGQRVPRNYNWKIAGVYGSLVLACFSITQFWYATGVHYPKTYTQDWAEAEVLHPRLQRTHLQRQDYQPIAALSHFDVRYPRWAKLDN